MNIARDYANNVYLKLAGRRVPRVWECEIRTKAIREEALNRLYASITGSQNTEHYQTYERGLCSSRTYHYIWRKLNRSQPMRKYQKLTISIYEVQTARVPLRSTLRSNFPTTL